MNYDRLLFAFPVITAIVLPMAKNLYNCPNTRIAATAALLRLLPCLGR